MRPDAAAVPITGPAMPSGPYSASASPTLTMSVSAASAVGIQGRCSEKNVRVNSRFTPANGSENENQKSACETSSVDAAPNDPYW